MSHYHHHVPGRIRIKCPSLRGNEALALSLEESLGSSEGVESVTANPVTGSLLVLFDAERVAPSSLIKHVHVLGVPTSPGPRGSASRPRQPASAEGKGISGLGRQAGQVFAGVVVEKVLERSAVALVGAIL